MARSLDPGTSREKGGGARRVGRRDNLSCMNDADGGKLGAAPPQRSKRGMPREKLYDEVGLNYRFFAKWRQLAFAGYLAVLGAAVSLLRTEPQYSVASLACVAFVCLAGIAFWIADMRTHVLTMHAIDAGQTLETSEPGFYGALQRRDQTQRRWWIRHSIAAGLPYLGSPALLVIVILFAGSTNHGNSQTVPATTASSGTSRASPKPNTTCRCSCAPPRCPT